MDCSGGLQSFGRRKRSTNETDDEPPGYFRVSTQVENTPGKCIKRQEDYSPINIIKMLQTI